MFIVGIGDFVLYVFCTFIIEIGDCVVCFHCCIGDCAVCSVLHGGLCCVCSLLHRRLSCVFTVA